MSFPNIPDVNATISITTEEAINLLLASIAFEELGLSHIINSEAEKIQYVLGTLPGRTPPAQATTDDLLNIDKTVQKVMRDVIKKEMLLEFKLEDAMSISTTTTSSTTTSTTSTQTTTTKKPVDLGSAWAVGTPYGDNNAQYVTFETGETEKTVVLGLGATYIPVGNVQILRAGNNLVVTYTTNPPYIMDQVQLYVGDVIPPSAAPGSFPYKHTVSSVDDYFTTYTFVVDITAYAGETIYIAAHAHILQQV